MEFASFYIEYEIFEQHEGRFGTRNFDSTGLWLLAKMQRRLIKL